MLNKLSDFLELPWGIGYSEAKELILEKGYNIYKEFSNQNISFDLEQIGPRAFFCFGGQYEKYDVDFKVGFHFNTFAGEEFDLWYPDFETAKIETLELKNKLIEKYGNPVESTSANRIETKWNMNSSEIIFSIYIIHFKEPEEIVRVLISCSNKDYKKSIQKKRKKWCRKANGI